MANARPEGWNTSIIEQLRANKRTTFVLDRI